MGAQLPLLREIYAAPLAESRVEGGGLASTSATASAAAEVEAGQAGRARQQGDAASSFFSSSAESSAAEGEAAAAAAARMYLPISLETRQELVRPLPPLPSQCPMRNALRPTPVSHTGPNNPDPRRCTQHANPRSEAATLCI